MNMNRIILIAWMALLLAGCGGGNVILDNPRSETVTFEIGGGDSHEVEAGGRTSISLDPGSHSVQVKLGDSILADTSFKLKEGGIIHSAGSKYVIWKDLYGVQTNRASLLSESWAELDSVRVYGDFTIYEPAWVFIEKNWDYGLDEEFPTSKTMYVTEDFQIESKVFRSKELIKYYKTRASAGKEE